MEQRQVRGSSEVRLSHVLSEIARRVDAERIGVALRALRRFLRLELDPAWRFRALRLQAECHLIGRQFSALKGVLQVLNAQNLSEENSVEVDLLHAHYLALLGSPQEALQRVKPLLRKTDPFKEHNAKGNWIVGLTCYRTGHYSWASRYYKKAAAYFQLTGQDKQTALVLINLALVAKNEGRVAHALRLLEEALQIIPKASPKTRLRLLVNRGICLIRMGELEGARVCFSEAESEASERSEFVFMISVHNNLGLIYQLRGSYATAEEFFLQALAMARAELSSRQECLSLEFLGENLAEQGKLSEALVHLDRAHGLAAKLAPKGDLMMEVLRRRGDVYVGLGEPEKAKHDLQRAVRLCSSRGEKREQVLARRSCELLLADSESDLSTQMQSVLNDLMELGDRFEYARTVYLILKDGRLTREKHLWLGEASAAATHYFNRMGSQIWKKRLQAVLGHSYDAKQQPLDRIADKPSITTQSSHYARTLDDVRLAARSAQPVLLLGETGSGKEVIAQLLHEWSERAEGPLVAINCGALPEMLVESELFGHVRGAFTGAEKDKVGLFESAHGGTVLLDEVADLPGYTQVKLLRFLDTGEVRRLGETSTRKVDVRVIAATNKNVTELVSKGTFRQDLFYRLNVFRIDIPPLRNRREDILPMARNFMHEESRSGFPVRVSDEVSQWLESYDWPGNVRQLRNMCCYLVAHGWGKPEISIQDLPPELHEKAISGARDSEISTYEREKRDLERAQILRALKEAKGKVSTAARILGMGRNTVSRRMREYGVSRSEFRGE